MYNKSLFAFGLLLAASPLALAQTSIQIGTPTAGATAPTSVAVGVSAGTKSTGQSNTFVGFQAGLFNTTGSFNTFLGKSAGQNNTFGRSNVFIGDGTGFANTTGSFNTFLGNNAGQNNRAGSLNVFVGTEAGFGNTGGASNVFVGNEAGRNNTDGIQNVFLGTTAGFRNTMGNFNTFLGHAAGQDNLTGRENVFLGHGAGAKSVASFNTFVGKSAGFSNTLGERNVFVGNQVGVANLEGSDNTFMGESAGRANLSGASNLFQGKDAGLGNVTGSGNVFLGRGAAFRNTSGSDNIAIGRDAGSANKTGKANTFLGSFAGTPADNLSNATALGFRAQVTVSNAVVIGSINGKNGATASAKVGIGTTAPTHQLQLSTDDAAKAGSSSWKVASDKRLKQDIKPFKEGLETITKINPVWFRYNGKAGMPTGKKYVGVIAQEMQKIAGYTVDTFTYQDAQGKQEEYLDYDANSLIYMLINAVKEQQQQLERQREQIGQKDQQLKNQQAELVTVQARLRALEDRIAPQAGAPGTSPAGRAATSPEASPEALLWQNEPNPTGGPTVIRYLVPAGAATAQIRLFNLKGEPVQDFVLGERGAGQLTLTTDSLPAGTYLYHLVVDGKSVASKKLVLIR